MPNTKLKEQEFLAFQALLVKESGLFFDFDRQYILEDSLVKRMQSRNCASFSSYYDLIAYDSAASAELKNLFNTITIGETYFFRNPDQFDVLKNFVIPELIKKKEKYDKTIRIWSAGCSTGEEPYTIALLLIENFPELENWGISIIATDINGNFLDHARKGVFGTRSVKEVPPAYLMKYFRQEGTSFFLDDRAKKKVNFFYHNLAKDTFAFYDRGSFDLVFCRNVIIYFDSATVKKTIDGFAGVLADGGYLFCGHAEVLWKITQKFKSVEFPHTFIYQKTLEPAKEEEKIFVDIPEIEKIPENAALAEPSAEKEVSRHLAQAVELSNQAKYNEAIAKLQEIIGQDALTVQAYYLLGVLFVKVGRIDEAVGQFKKAVFLDPHLPVVHYNLGEIYAVKKDFEAAKKEFDRAIKLLEKTQPKETVRFSENMNTELLMLACKRSREKIA